jgi:hypothetical protein
VDLGRFFPADITHLRFPGSQAVQQLERDDAASKPSPDEPVDLDDPALAPS